MEVSEGHYLIEKIYNFKHGFQQQPMMNRRQFLYSLAPLAAANSFFMGDFMSQLKGLKKIGILDLEGIIAAAKKAGVRHFFVEQDMVADPERALKRSHEYLEKLKN